MMPLPAFVSYARIRFAPGDEGRFTHVAVPAALERAVAKRKLEFLAGRHCARQALEHLLDHPFAEPIPVGVDRAPVWPAGVVGAITHAAGFAAAAVARASDASGLGLDSEPIVTADAMDAVATQAASRDELDALATAGLSAEVLLTLVFSAKESLFKCLYPRVGRYFDFQEARIVEVSASSQRFTVELLTPLGGLAANTRLGGRFALVDDLVHTGIVLAA
jgi:enterobactin synthetase component D